jgi:glycosyltransferase involved in cell wall biosynthesis
VTRIYLIASTPYGYLHHRFQKLADGFRTLPGAVTYLEQTYGWRAYLWGGRPGLGHEVRTALRHHAAALFHRGRNEPAPAGDPRFEVLQLPLVIPTNRLNCAAVERLNARVFRSVLLETLHAHADGETVAVVDNPLWGAVLERGDFTRIYYDCIDDVALYAGHASLERFLDYERRLVGCSDAVFVTAASLEERLRGVDPVKPVLRLPNGVEYEWFQREASRRSKPEDIQAITRPVVGYVGSIADWMDYGLVREVAARRPDVSFVFVGPTDHPKRVAQLEQSPNVHWLGRKPYHDVPAYVAAFDVCWIPFLGGRIVEHTNPIKLFEYFALGKPVVTTPMGEVDRYGAERLVYTGNGGVAVTAALEEALNDGDDARRSRRLAVAREHAWSGIIQRMHATISGRQQ